jgi:hypothetical protein
MLNCSSMRAGVILSALLLGSGILLGVIAVSTGEAIPASHLSLFLVLGGAVVLSLVFLDALLPGAARRLDGCRH